MDRNEATKLCQTLLRAEKRKAGPPTAKFFCEVEGDRVVFKGGRDGWHSLAINASSPERVQAHWRGYVENTEPSPRVGDKVYFPSSSAHEGFRIGRVIKAGPKRLVIAYTFKTTGSKATATISRDRVRTQPVRWR